MINLLNWFNKPTTSVVKFVYTGMDLKTWRETPELISYARELWVDPRFQHALSALKNAMPSGYPLRGGRMDRPISDTEANIELGRKEGYQDCLNAIFSLPLRIAEPQQEVEADFDPKDYNKEIE